MRGCATQLRMVFCTPNVETERLKTHVNRSTNVHERLENGRKKYFHQRSHNSSHLPPNANGTDEKVFVRERSRPKPQSFGTVCCDGHLFDRVCQLATFKH